MDVRKGVFKWIYWNKKGDLGIGGKFFLVREIFGEKYLLEVLGGIVVFGV